MSAASSGAIAPRTPVRSKQRERLFYTAMAVAFAATVFAGFARTYFLKGVFGSPALSPLLHVHGVVFSAWLVMLLAQTVLVAANRTRLHRKLGIAGVVIAVLMVAIGITTAIIRASQGAAPQGAPPPLVFLAIPLGDICVFATLLGAAFYFRRKPAIHKRLMLLATIAIMPAAVGRLPFAFIREVGPPAFFGLTDLFVVACLIYDYKTLGRVQRATAIGALILVASQPLRLIIAGTPAWLSFATWLTGLVK